MAATARHEGANLELERLFGYQHSSTCDLPDPAPLLENLARCAIEIIIGIRDVEQVSRWMTEDTYGRLARRAILARRARAAKGASPVRAPVRVSSVRAQHPADGIVEGVIVVEGRARSRVVAIRLEGLDGRWRAAALAVL